MASTHVIYLLLKSIHYKWENIIEITDDENFIVLKDKNESYLEINKITNKMSKYNKCHQKIKYYGLLDTKFNLFKNFKLLSSIDNSTPKLLDPCSSDEIEVFLAKINPKLTSNIVLNSDLGNTLYISSILFRIPYSTKPFILIMLNFNGDVIKIKTFYNFKYTTYRRNDNVIKEMNSVMVILRKRFWEREKMSNFVERFCCEEKSQISC